MKKINTYLPVFPGFYNTIFEANIDYEIESINQERESKGLEPIDSDDVEFDYKDYENQVGKRACAVIERELPKGLVKSITFESISSPKEYNYRNDSINCEIKLTQSGEKAILKYLSDNSEAFAGYLRNNYTSCSGFISSYDNNISGFMIDEPLNNDHKLGSILNFICENEGITQETLYYGCDDCYLSATNYRELIGE